MLARRAVPALIVELALVAAGCGGAGGLPASCEVIDGSSPPRTGARVEGEPGDAVQGAATTAAWRADLACLADAIRTRHADPFFAISEGEFDEAVDRIDGDIPTLSDYEVLLAFSTLTAMISSEGRDGHTHLRLLGGSVPWPQTLFPLRLYSFSDGVFVVDALAPHTDLIGAKVLAIDGTPTDEIVGALSPAVSGDNDQDRRARVAWLLPYSEMLRAADVTVEIGSAEWALQRAGAVPFAVRIAAVDGASYWLWTASSPRQMIPAPGEPPLYLSNLEEDFWSHYIGETDTVFVQYNAATAETRSGGTLRALAEAIEETVETNPVERVIVDLRHNTGGDNTTYGPLLDVLASGAVDRPGKLFAIVGRHTWSAGMNFATELERRTGALFVGEPTGGSPNQYGDADPVTLPNSKIVVMISTRYHQQSDPDDERLTIEPDIPAPLSSGSYFANRDPALEAVLARR